jgi:3-hydroxyacyl-[acyl-carrier-protein] dehydratase
MRYQFLDEILEVDREHIVASYRFRKDEFFYPGHFPGRPTTPGTILLEAMCQCGMTAHSYYFLALELGMESARRHWVLFTGSEVEWFEQVRPGDRIIMHSKVLAWRRRRIRACVRMLSETGILIAKSTVSGISVLGSTEDLPEKQPSSNSNKYEASKTFVP